MLFSCADWETAFKVQSDAVGNLLETDEEPIS